MVTAPANSLSRYLPLFEKLQKKTVLDYGSGNLRNAIYLHGRGYRVYAVDLPDRIKDITLPRLSFLFVDELKDFSLDVDIALCTFVLNLIDSDKRTEVMDTIAANMARGGYFLVETREFTIKELDLLIVPKGFVRVHEQRGRYTIIALYRYLGVYH
ncbi:class I SAM-dependent methyltransferase [Phosphitispora sp. TUW77]|uniref:class I SAM-dependent methyltransferase n=1 Tax=Phosphitispora sp. TUW77 TaxID=3152361 RepID=UPI003AB50E91